MNINENMTLAECLEYIRHELKHFDHPNLDTVGIEESLDRIDELTRWIPVSERLPTEEDGEVLFMYDGRDVLSWRFADKDGYTHWKRLDSPSRVGR